MWMRDFAILFNFPFAYHMKYGKTLRFLTHNKKQQRWRQMNFLEPKNLYNFNYFLTPSSFRSIITIAKWLWTFSQRKTHTQFVKLFFVLRSNSTLSGYVCRCMYVCPLCGLRILYNVQLLNAKMKEREEMRPNNKMMAKNEENGW